MRWREAFVSNLAPIGGKRRNEGKRNWKRAENEARFTLYNWKRGGNEKWKRSRLFCVFVSFVSEP